MAKHRRRTRNELMALAPPIDTWPICIEEGIEKNYRERFAARKEAIKLYFQGAPTKQITEMTGVVRTTLSALARKCLALNADGEIYGFRALLPFARHGEYSRKAPLMKKLPEAHGGQTGALLLVFQKYPDIEDELSRLIMQEARHRRVHEYKLRPCDLHRIFLKLLRAKGVNESDWPFNMKHLGRRSIEHYMRDVLNRRFARSVGAREGREAKAHLHVGTSHAPFLVYEEPYDAVEIDAYHIDQLATVALKTPEGTETDVLLERLWLIAAVERKSSAVLAYSIIYRSEVTADDIVGVIRQAAGGVWAPMTLTIPGLCYPAAGGLPNGVIKALRGALWSVTLLDGALAHLANAVRERARVALGFIINWGPVGHFERRPHVERVFHQIARNVFHRMPSTTGSNPHNGRAANAEEKAVRYKIRAAEMEQLVDVYIAQSNATENEGLSFLTPLQYLNYFVERLGSHFIVRRLPQATDPSSKLFAQREVHWVRGGLQSGRRPYVQIDRVHYSSPVLANAAHLIGQRIVVEIDEDDMRQIRIFLMSGAELGYLAAQGKWGITKHSRRTRKTINTLLAKRILTLSQFDDPVQMYLAYLSAPERETKKPPRAKEKIGLSSKQATEATRVAREADLSSSPLVVAGRTKDDLALTNTTSFWSLMGKPAPMPVKVLNRRR
jgi:putative transposase